MPIDYSDCDARLPSAVIVDLLICQLTRRYASPNEIQIGV